MSWSPRGSCTIIIYICLNKTHLWVAIWNRLKLKNIDYAHFIRICLSSQKMVFFIGVRSLHTLRYFYKMRIFCFQVSIPLPHSNPPDCFEIVLRTFRKNKGPPLNFEIKFFPIQWKKSFRGGGLSGEGSDIWLPFVFRKQNRKWILVLEL